MKPIERFIKDLILLALIIVLLIGLRHIKPLLGKFPTTVLALLGFLGSLWFGYHVLMHLPTWDFRAYNVGANIQEGMATPEDAPKAIKTKCSAFQKQAKELKDYISCIAQLEHTKCLVMIQAAKHKKSEDMPYYVQCNKLGQEAYNIGKPDLKKTHP